MRRTETISCLVAGFLVCTGLLRAAGTGAQDEGDIRARLKAYAPVKLQTDLTRLGPREREALAKIVVALDAVDDVYWKQMGRQALEARRAFDKAADPVNLLYRDFVMINYGPFDIRKENERFVAIGASSGERLPGAGFYPEDMTKAEFEARVKTHPELQDTFEKPNTLIRRVDGVLVAIPYESLYIDELSVASQALGEAAALVESPSLRRYLSLRSQALLSGDYYASDVAWLDVKDNLLDVVIGPIETYDDGLLGLKASYEGALLVKETAGLPAEALQAGQFRHGPLELAGPELAAVVFATEPETASLDRRLGDDLAAAGAAVLTVAVNASLQAVGPPRGRTSGTGTTVSLSVEPADRLLRPAPAIVPVQLLAWKLALERGRTPGLLTRATKVTASE